MINKIHFYGVLLLNMNYYEFKIKIQIWYVILRITINKFQAYIKYCFVIVSIFYIYLFIFTF